ncbi:MAG: 50S ribosomal protein L10 [Lachnospiraceae bacterium]|jgi:large subunit ribosomal protein L10|nr:50S ribosomal protein L10 [Lachnospiraceae bacterium]MDY2945917.1 50S ribosomal protein L10 [Lachnospiraceae bacterium]MDY6341932.1 50S ribosomal protein L10 [Lachnospiraceae bacterium]
MAKVEEKQPVVKEISAKIDGAASAVIVDARGLTVTEDTALRKALREAGVEYKVYKNTMMKIAFNGTDFAQLDPYLNGPSALAVSKDDATAAARVIAKFQKTSDKLQMKGGVVEGTLYDEAGMAEIAKIPSREELLSKLLGSIQSPMANFARVIKQIADKKAEGGDAPAEAAAEAPAAEAAPAEEAKTEA